MRESRSYRREYNDVMSIAASKELARTVELKL
jgi:hypothetical protein